MKSKPKVASAKPKVVLEAVDPVSPDGLFRGDAGEMTPKAMAYLQAYARQWVRGTRDLDLEREAPGLADEFYAIRADADVASGWEPAATPPAVFVTK